MKLNQFLTLTLKLAICVLILSVTWKIVEKYVDYFPPDFTSNFLLDRETYFFGSYQWAFYPHLLAGPLSLMLGMVLLSDRFRTRFPQWHSLLGRVQVVSVLFVIAPSGFWMALHAHAGVGVKLGFALLAVATGWSAFLGVRFAIKRQFPNHQLWMWRCYVLLCSAVVTRLIGGAFFMAGLYGEWTYLFTAWASWLVPLVAFEIYRWRVNRLNLSRPRMISAFTTSETSRQLIEPMG